MEDTLKKRKRTENYTSEETFKLLEYVRKYHHIVENKKTDAFTWRQKDQAWERISREYNSSSTSKRTAKMLRSKFETLKKEARKYAAAQRETRLQTDGSAPTKIKPNRMLDIVQEIMSLECLPSMHDTEMSVEAVTIEAANTADRSCEAAEAIPELLSFEMDVPVISSESLQNCSYLSEPNAEQPPLQQSPSAVEVGSSAAGTCAQSKIHEEQLVENLQKKYPDLRITVSDLKNPTPKFLQQYFMAFFEEFGADVSAFLEPTPEQLQDLEYPVAFKTVLPIVNYFYAVKYILQHIARDLRISITDLTAPNPGKTKALITVAEEFYSYADKKTVEILTLEERMLQKKEYYNQLHHEVDMLKEMINKRAAEAAQMQLCKQQLSEKSAAQDIKLTELQMKAMKLDEENKDMETEVNRCANVLNEVKTEKVQLEETLKDLEFKVSRLPTKATLAAVAEKKMKLLEEMQSAAKRVEEKRNLFADYEKRKKLWEEIRSSLEEDITLSKELQSKKAELEELEKQQASEEEKRKADEEKCRKWHAKIAQRAEKRAAEKAQLLERRLLLEKELEEKKRKNEILKKEKQKQLKETEQQTLKKKEELLMIGDENKRICREYDEKYIKLLKEHEEILFRMTGKQFKLRKERKSDNM